MSRTTLPARIFRAQVVEVVRLSPGMLRITFGGDGLADFQSTGVGDEYLRIFLPRADGVLVLPTATESAWTWPEEVEHGELRTFTVRAHRPDRGEVAIDFGVHGHGPAMQWALTAKPGDEVGMNTPTGLYDAPDGIRWRLLIADVAGLPAAARLMEEAPAGVRTRVILEVPDATHQLPLDPPPGTEVTWTHGGNGRAPSMIAEMVRSLDLPAGRGYIWVTGEMRVLREVRQHLREVRHLPSSSYKAVSYWADNAEEWAARYNALPPETLEELRALWDTDRDETEVEADYDARLEALGL